MKIKLLFIAVSMITTTNLAAQGVLNVNAINPFASEDPRAPKMHGGLSLGFSKQSDLCEQAFVSTSDCDNNGFAWKVHGGVRLNPMFGVEGGYRQISDTKVTGTDSSGNSVSLENEVSGFDLSAVGYMPLSPVMEGFGKAGMMRWNQDTYASSSTTTANSDESGNSFLLGAGVQLLLTENLKAKAEWEHVMNVGGSSVESDLSMFSAGISFSAL